MLGVRPQTNIIYMFHCQGNLCLGLLPKVTNTVRSSRKALLILHIFSFLSWLDQKEILSFFIRWDMIFFCYYHLSDWDVWVRYLVSEAGAGVGGIGIITYEDRPTFTS